MADLKTVANEVKVYVANCPDLMVYQALSNAAREFFTRARCWAELVNVPLVGSTYSYVPDPGAGNEWVGVNWAKIDGHALDPASMDTPINHTAEGLPRYYGSLDGAGLIVYPTPNEAYTLAMSLFCVPVKGGYEIPNAMFSKYYLDIAHGAAARLLNQKSYPWYDPRASTERYNQFTIGIQQAKANFLTGYTKADPTVQMRPLA